MKRLAVTAVTTGVVWSALHYTDGHVDDINLITLLMIGGVFAIASVVMLAGTSRWSTRALGLLMTSIGTAVLYCAAAISNIRDTRSPEWAIDLARSCYIVGGPLLAVGLFMWVHTNWGPPSRVVTTDYSGPERRSGPPGRRVTDQKEPV